MDEWVPVGVFAPSGKQGPDFGETLYPRSHRIRSGAQTVTVTVPKKPSDAGIGLEPSAMHPQPTILVIPVVLILGPPSAAGMTSIPASGAQRGHGRKESPIESVPCFATLPRMKIERAWESRKRRETASSVRSSLW